MTEEEKLLKRETRKAVAALVKEHEQRLAEALPEVAPVLIEQALEGDIRAIREIHAAVGLHDRNQGPMVAVQVNIGSDKEEFS